MVAAIASGREEQAQVQSGSPEAAYTGAKPGMQQQQYLMRAGRALARLAAGTPGAPGGRSALCAGSACAAQPDYRNAAQCRDRGFCAVAVNKHVPRPDPTGTALCIRARNSICFRQGAGMLITRFAV